MLNITTARAQGNRYYQEDRYVVYKEIDTGGTLVCVMDGHGGEQSAEACYQSIHLHVWNGIKSLKTKDTAERLRALVSILHEQTKDNQSGTTFSCVYLPKKSSKIWIAVLGDSPVIVSVVGDGYHVSPEHNVRSNEEEAKAAVARGGFIEGGYLFTDNPNYDLTGPGLQMSRALGDAPLDRVLSREPTIYSLPFKRGDWALVCTDGLLSPSHNKKAQKDRLEHIVKLIKEGKNADNLTDDAIKAKTGDNVTAILIRKV